MLKLINRAEEDLIFQRFTNCLKKCEEGVSKLKAQDDTLDQSMLTHFCVLAIQAYAELNCWQEVLQYVTSVFNGIEDCPARVVELCLMLYSRVEDYNTCTAIAHIWVRNPNNSNQDGYQQVVQVYIWHVLVPQGMWEAVPGFLEGCTGLEKAGKQGMLMEVNERKKLLEKEKGEELMKRLAQEAEDEEKRKDTDKQEKATISWWQYMMNAIHRHPTLSRVILGGHLGAFLIVIYIVIRRRKGNLAQQVMSLLGSVWFSVLRLWRAMFAPFYLSR